jgi:hypothetical protein
MNFFPVVDPIPLPAPVWLFKLLHIVTLALHFVALEILLGGLLVAVVLNFLGHSRRGTPGGFLNLNAASSMARRLPVVMTYVINLGVPPLLFAQVLYGRAIYTSSVLIGMYWISVIVLLTIAYWMLYKFAAGAEQGRSAWGWGLSAWLICGGIAKIYNINMTLMLRPEVWGDMYATTATGTHLPPHDPTMLPRWLYMMLGGLVVAGLLMIYLAGRKAIEEPVRQYLAKTGGVLTLLVVALVGLGFWVVAAQAPVIQQALAANSLAKISGFAWIGAAALVLIMGGWAAFGKTRSSALSWLGPVCGFLMIAAMTLYRDVLRDVSLTTKNFDVWNRDVVTNWSVVGLFLVLFVVGLGIAGWLISVVVRAKTVSEKVNP